MRRIAQAGRTALVFGALALVIAGAGWDPEKEKLEKEKAAADRTVAAFKRDSPRLDVYFREAHGYAVFPTIGTGGVGISGAYGKGLVYERGRAVGHATSTKAGLGLTLGGGSYSELLFFRDEAALDRFMNGKLALQAGAKVVGPEGGAATETSWADGVAVFLRSKKGLMADASVSGQVFAYQALSTAQASR